MCHVAGVFGTLPGALANPTLAAAAAALAARGGLPGGLMSPAPGLGLAAGASPQARPILHQVCALSRRMFTSCFTMSTQMH